MADSDGDGSGDGGAFSSNDATLHNSIVAGNFDTGGEAPDCFGGYVRFEGYNLLGTAAGCTPAAIDPTDVVGADPRLGPLADHGGFAKTHALLAGSPAIDGGDPAGCTDGVLPLSTDQRGVARPQFGRCDIGAYEFASACSAPFAPAGSCAAADAGRSTLLVQKGADPLRNKLTWKWRSSGPVTKGDFGLPTAATDLILCLGDGAGTVLASELVPAGGICLNASCWREVTRGFTYKDRDLSPQGVQALLLRATSSGGGTISLTGKGSNLFMPPLPLTAPITARLVRSDSPLCWEATYSTPRRSDPQQFKARSD